MYWERFLTCFLKCPQICGWSRWQADAWNSIQLPCKDRDPTTRAISPCLPECMLAETWNWKPSRTSIPTLQCGMWISQEACRALHPMSTPAFLTQWREATLRLAVPTGSCIFVCIIFLYLHLHALLVWYPHTCAWIDSIIVSHMRDTHHHCIHRSH